MPEKKKKQSVSYQIVSKPQQTATNGVVDEEFLVLTGLKFSTQRGFLLQQETRVPAREKRNKDPISSCHSPSKS